MEQRWGLPLIAWPSRLRPNYWDLVALPMVLGVLAVIAWGGMAMGARYHIGGSWDKPDISLVEKKNLSSAEAAASTAVPAPAASAPAPASSAAR